MGANRPSVGQKKKQGKPSGLSTLRQQSRSQQLEVLVDHALQAMGQGDYFATETLCKQVLKLNAADLRAHACLGTIAFQAGNFSKSHAHYCVIDEFSGDSEPTLRALVATSGRLRKHESLLVYLLRLAKLTESSPSDSLDKLPLDTQALFIELALRLLVAGHPVGFNYVGRIISVHNPEIAHVFDEMFLDQSQSSIKTFILGVTKTLTNVSYESDVFAVLHATWLTLFGKSDEAFEELQRAIQHRSECWRAWILLADLAGTHKSYVRLKTLAPLATSQQTLPADTYCALVSHFIRNAAFDDASQMIEQAASCVAQPEKLLAQRVVLSYALGQPVEAVEFARVLAHKFPRSSDVLLMFSQILIALGYFDDAQQVHQQILSIPHDYKSLLLERAHWHAAQYRFSQAEEVLRSLASARPADLDVSRRWLVMKLLDGDVIGAVELDRFIDDQLELDNKSQQRLNWRHDFERTLLKECFTNRYAFEALRNSRRLPTDLQLPKLVRGLSDEPGYLGFAIAALNSLRRSGAMTRVASGSEVQIPRRVTQYWDRQVPPKEVQAMMDSWKAQNPTWTYKRFNDVNAWDYLKDNASPAVLRAFESAAHPALRADLLRLAVLAFEGGVWGDADDRCVVPLDLLPHHGAELWLVQESFGTLGNNFIASRAGHPFVAYALEKVSRNILERQGRTVWFVSGPGAISLAFCNFYSERLKLSKLPHGVRIFDTYTFSRFVAQHLPLVYKHEGQHWNDRVERTKSLFRKPSGRPLAGAVKGSLKLMKDGRFQERQSVAKPTA